MSQRVFPPKKILVPTDLGAASAVAMGFAHVMQLADAPLLLVPRR